MLKGFSSCLIISMEVIAASKTAGINLAISAIDLLSCFLIQLTVVELRGKCSASTCMCCKSMWNVDICRLEQTKVLTFVKYLVIMLRNKIRGILVVHVWSPLFDALITPIVQTERTARELFKYSSLS